MAPTEQTAMPSAQPSRPADPVRRAFADSQPAGNDGTSSTVQHHHRQADQQPAATPQSQQPAAGRQSRVREAPDPAQDQHAAEEEQVVARNFFGDRTSRSQLDTLFNNQQQQVRVARQTRFCVCSEL